MNHIHTTHRCNQTGRYTVPLPGREGEKLLEESRGLTIWSFLSLEKSLQSEGQFQVFAKVVQEYFDTGQTKPGPVQQAMRPCEEVFYFPVNGVTKASSTTT